MPKQLWFNWMGKMPKTIAFFVFFMGCKTSVNEDEKRKEINAVFFHPSINMTPFFDFQEQDCEEWRTEKLDNGCLTQMDHAYLRQIKGIPVCANGQPIGWTSCPPRKENNQ